MISASSRCRDLKQSHSMPMNRRPIVIMRRSCSDSQLAASQMDGVFGSDSRFVIPDFQREFERKPWDISELMRSIFLDYFIGSLLLWKGKKDNFESLACEAIYGFQ